MADSVPTLYEWCGGAPALHRLTDVFYARVLADPVLEPVFRHMGPDHRDHVARWLGEVFGGPAEYTGELGGYPAMLSPPHRPRDHRGAAGAVGHPDRRERRRGGPPGRPGVPLGVRGIRGVGHSDRPRQLRAGREPPDELPHPPVGLGRGPAVPALTPGGGQGPRRREIAAAVDRSGPLNGGAARRRGPHGRSPRRRAGRPAGRGVEGRGQQRARAWLTGRSTGEHLVRDGELPVLGRRL